MTPISGNLMTLPMISRLGEFKICRMPANYSNMTFSNWM
jgi:hypothetical protein